MTPPRVSPPALLSTETVRSALRIIARLIVWALGELLTMFPPNVMRLPPMTNAPAPEAKLRALKVVSAARLLLGVRRSVPLNVSVSSETGAVRSPSQFSAVLQLSFTPPPSQIRSAAPAPRDDAPRIAHSAA